jgi:hypothetical protein
MERETSFRKQDRLKKSSSVPQLRARQRNCPNFTKNYTRKLEGILAKSINRVRPYLFGYDTVLAALKMALPANKNQITKLIYAEKQNPREHHWLQKIMRPNICLFMDSEAF